MFCNVMKFLKKNWQKTHFLVLVLFVGNFSNKTIIITVSENMTTFVQNIPEIIRA